MIKPVKRHSGSHGSVGGMHGQLVHSIGRPTVNRVQRWGTGVKRIVLSIHSCSWKLIPRATGIHGSLNGSATQAVLVVKWIDKSWCDVICHAVGVDWKSWKRFCADAKFTHLHGWFVADMRGVVCLQSKFPTVTRKHEVLKDLRGGSSFFWTCCFTCCKLCGRAQSTCLHYVTI